MAIGDQAIGGLAELANGVDPASASPTSASSQTPDRSDDGSSVLRRHSTQRALDSVVAAGHAVKDAARDAIGIQADQLAAEAANAAEAAQALLTLRRVSRSKTVIANHTGFPWIPLLTL